MPKLKKLNETFLDDFQTLCQTKNISKHLIITISIFRVQDLRRVVGRFIQAGDVSIRGCYDPSSIHWMFHVRSAKWQKSWMSPNFWRRAAIKIASAIRYTLSFLEGSCKEPHDGKVIKSICTSSWRITRVDSIVLAESVTSWAHNWWKTLTQVFRWGKIYPKNILREASFSNQKLPESKKNLENTKHIYFLKF